MNLHLVPMVMTLIHLWGHVLVNGKPYNTTNKLRCTLTELTKMYKCWLWQWCFVLIFFNLIYYFFYLLNILFTVPSLSHTLQHINTILPSSPLPFSEQVGVPLCKWIGDSTRSIVTVDLQFVWIAFTKIHCNHSHSLFITICSLCNFSLFYYLVINQSSYE